MKRILLLIDSLYSGGAQRQIVGLAKLLKEKGYEIKLADYWNHDFYDQFLRDNGIEFEHRVAKGKLKIFNSIRTLIRDFKPDVVICYLEHSSSIACAIKYLHLTSTFRLIVSERNTTQILGRADKIRFRLFQLAADVVVPNSHSQAKFITKHFPKLASKTVTITNYIDTEKFCPLEKCRENISKRPIRFIVVGRVVEQKNPIRFLEAISLVKNKRPNASFVVDWYGMPYPQEYFDTCLKLKDQLGLKDIVRFNPPTQKIISEYRQSDVFILPSIYEGFPNVLCEAMSCGLPTAASAVCDNPMILNQGKSGLLFDPKSVDDMADKIIQFLDMTNSQLKEMGRRSRDAAVQKFSRDKFINAYISLIEK